MTKRKKLSEEISKRKKLSEEISKVTKEPVKKKIIEVKKTISTGSTLLDLDISGKRTKYGGIPAGILLEIHGPSSSGKTALLSEMAGNVQSKGGEVLFNDPEGRLDAEYAEIYGMDIEKDNYFRPDTVNEMFQNLWNWNPKDKDKINLMCNDSLAALSTEMEMEDRDKMGMKRAKDFSENLRKSCRMIAQNNWIIACSNQERESQTGIVTPGGKSITYYSSLKIRVCPAFTGSKIKKEKTIGKGKIKKIIGIRSKYEIKKSSIDEPFREGYISVIFNFGIDDIRENLIYLKETEGLSKYPCTENQEISMIDKAIAYIEDNNLEDDLKERVVVRWNEIQDAFKIKRKKKKR